MTGPISHGEETAVKIIGILDGGGAVEAVGMEEDEGDGKEEEEEERQVGTFILLINNFFIYCFRGHTLMTSPNRGEGVCRI